MSVSFYDLMKYAKTGIASPEMTGYDKLRAKACFGGYTVTTITGVPPISFKSDGKPLTAWSIAGNGQQTGTPTPDAPIMPEFCGERTGNLWGGQMEQGTITSDGSEVPAANRIRCTGFLTLPAGDYTISATSDLEGQIRVFGFVYDLNGQFEERIPSDLAPQPFSFTLTAKKKFRFVLCIVSGAQILNFTPSDINSIMLNTGSTAKPFEPFGYKIPITCAGQTVPVYLGQTPTVRRVRKLVLTGEENWDQHPNSTGLFRIDKTGYKRDRNTVTCMCTHYTGAPNVGGYNEVRGNETAFYAGASADSHVYYIRDSRFSNADDFKSYLSAQYAAGTPVTVWYVLAEPTTGIVNEPLAKIGDYADELSSTDAAVTIPTAKGQNTLTVDTDLQPSEMTITYKG